ncbi:MAG: helix-turn-helix domain-containing protein [Kiritimatiellaeota bacterium]|nr:helix-turn-helix domain-containing protein [Kiritimatiellota bacterium]
MRTPSLQNQIRDARRQHGLTQAELARQAGCTQSALSMYESGQDSALAAETLRKIAGLLGVALKKEEAPAEPSAPPRRAFCPNLQCPAAFPYFAGDELLARPRFYGHARHCPHCGEFLEAACPHCRAPLGENLGACCAACGKPLVLATLPGDVSPREWLRERRTEAAWWREVER